MEVESTSFQPYVTATVCGPNWLMVGEAASMPDPLTGNGVTSGMRHARHAVDAILAAGAGDQIDERRRRTYSRHVSRLGHAFNAHIENAVYRPHLRWGLGLQAATYVYTFFAFFMNALHARFDPRGIVGMTCSVCCSRVRERGSADGRWRRGPRSCGAGQAYTASER